MATNGTTHHRANEAFEHGVPLLINGKDVTTSTTFQVTSPLTNKTIWRSSAAGVKEAEDAISAAEVAFPAWSATKPAVRRDILLKAASIMSARSEELAEYQEIETGATHDFAAGFIVPTGIEMLKDVAGRIVTCISGSIPATAEQGKNALVLKEPYGVVLGIAPWNAPYILGLRAVVYAIAGGNTCILKGSELSPRCWWAIGSILTEAGLPNGVLNVLVHRTEDAPEVTRVLIQHPAVRKVSFTGSTATGRIVAELAGKALKPVLLELGGKAPAIVLKDANLEEAAKWVATGGLLHAGQICMSTERAIVEKSVAKEFGELLKKAVEDQNPQSGAAKVLINAAGVEKNKRLVKDAVSKGAKILTGDVEAVDQSETRMHPIVVQDVKKGMDLFHTESFGPTFSLFTVETEDEAVELANDTEYGLSSALFTRDLAKGLRIAKRIDSGAVHINAMSVHDEPLLPHGGVKMSGFGRFNASEGIEEFLKKKTVTWMD